MGARSMKMWTSWGGLWRTGVAMGLFTLATNLLLLFWLCLFFSPSGSHGETDVTSVRSFYHESCDSVHRMFSVTVLSWTNKVAYKTLSSYYESHRFNILYFNVYKICTVYFNHSHTMIKPIRWCSNFVRVWIACTNHVHELHVQTVCINLMKKQTYMKHE